MSGFNKTEAYYSSLKVHNQGKNILNMDPEGHFTLKSDSIINHSFKNIKNFSQNTTEFKTMDGNLTLYSENGKLKLQNGNQEILYNIKSQLEETSLPEEEEEEIFFIDLEKLNSLRDDSFLVESLNNNLCIYGNQGINNISHDNYKIISDKEIVCQALKKIRLNTMGTISLNSENIIGSCEEDIVLVSQNGEIKIGGNGLDNSAIIIENQNVSFGKSNNLEQNQKQVNINLANQEKNFDGLQIEGNKVFPEINLLKKTDFEENNLAINLGNRENDINNSFFAKFSIENNKTHLITLDNFEFSLADIDSKVYNENKNYTIKNYINKFTVELEEKVNDIVFSKFFIDRNNCANIKTTTNSHLHIGTNNLDILNISNNGRVGINTKNIEGSFHITNNYGKTFNIRQEKDKKYFKHKIIQLENSNYIILANSLYNNKYNLEGFVYNINNCLLNHTILKEHSFEEIEFSVIHNPINHNSIIIAFCFFNQEALFITEINTYNHFLKRKRGLGKKIINEDIEKSSYPFLLQYQENHILVYRDIRNDREIHFVKIYSSQNEILLNYEINKLGKISDIVVLNDEIIMIYQKNKDYFIQIESLILKHDKYYCETKSNSKINTEDLDINSITLINENDKLFIFYIDVNKNLYQYENAKHKLLFSNVDLDSKINLVNYQNENHLIFLSEKIVIFNLEKLKEIKLLNKFENINQLSYFTIKNSNNEYIKSLLVWETTDNNNFNSNTILLKDDNSLSNLVKISNSNNNIEIKDNGDIFIEDIIECSKQNNITKIKNNLVISEIENLEGGTEGQINFHNEDLLIYLGNKWKKIKLEDI